jgi:hypothetical protein
MFVSFLPEAGEGKVTIALLLIVEGGQPDSGERLAGSFNQLSLKNSSSKSRDEPAGKSMREVGRLRAARRDGQPVESAR